MEEYALVFPAPKESYQHLGSVKKVMGSVADESQVPFSTLVENANPEFIAKGGSSYGTGLSAYAIKGNRRNMKNSFLDDMKLDIMNSL